MKDSTSDRLIAKRIIAIDGEINDNKVHYIKNCLVSLLLQGSPPVKVIISSGGGNVGAGMDIYDLLKLYPGKKTAVVVCEARSMAAVILQACDRRLATQNAGITIHNTSGGVTHDELMDEEKIKKLRQEYTDCQKRINIIFSSRANKSLEEIKIQCAKNEDMCAEKAKEFGLIDEVWTKTLNDIPD